jgi:hypothetical protein
MKNSPRRWVPRSLSSGQGLLGLKHQKRCRGFYKNLKQTILMKSQQATRSDFDISVRVPQCLHDRQ